jgi:hypothetical protein
MVCLLKARKSLKLANPQDSYAPKWFLFAQPSFRDFHSQTGGTAFAKDKVESLVGKRGGNDKGTEITDTGFFVFRICEAEQPASVSHHGWHGPPG